MLWCHGRYQGSGMDALMKTVWYDGRSLSSGMYALRNGCPGTMDVI